MPMIHNNLGVVFILAEMISSSVQITSIPVRTIRIKTSIMLKFSKLEFFAR